MGELTIEHKYDVKRKNDRQAKNSKNIFTFGNKKTGKKASFQVLNPKFYRHLILHGDVGLGEAYFLKYWHTDDLMKVLSLFMENSDSLFSFSGKNNFYKWFSWPFLQIYRIGHFLRRNTVPNSRKNISDHYDLSNQFYASWLSEEMAYSSAWFEKQNESLAQAQKNKFEKIASKLELNAKDHVLEIGCGWGGFSEFIVRKYGCKVTAITISESQYQFFQERIQMEKLSELIDLKFKDYRTLSGKFSKIVSIEMIEAIGLRYYKSFFNQCSKLLTDDGILVLQCITFPDCYFSGYLKNYDFIQEHIFPGSSLLSVRRMLQAMEKTGSLYLFNLESLGIDYARTLYAWRNRLGKAREKIMKMGFSEKFMRKWVYYLTYCEVGFMYNYINNIQMVLTKVQNRNVGKYKDFFNISPPPSLEAK